jgi:hypothetical protein
MKDLDPGRSGREDYNPEREGKPADRSTESNPGGMEGSPSERDRNKGDRDRKRDQQGSQSDRDRDRGMEGSSRERDRDKGTGGSQEERNRRGGMGDPDRESRIPSQSRGTDYELNDEDTATEPGTRSRGAGHGRGHDSNR